MPTCRTARNGVRVHRQHAPRPPRSARGTRARQVLAATRLATKVILPRLGRNKAVVCYELQPQVVGVIGEKALPHAREAAACVDKDLTIGGRGKQSFWDASPLVDG